MIHQSSAVWIWRDTVTESAPDTCKLLLSISIISDCRRTINRLMKETAGAALIEGTVNDRWRIITWWFTCEATAERRPHLLKFLLLRWSEERCPPASSQQNWAVIFLHLVDFVLYLHVSTCVNVTRWMFSSLYKLHCFCSVSNAKYHIIKWYIFTDGSDW